MIREYYYYYYQDYINYRCVLIWVMFIYAKYYTLIYIFFIWYFFIAAIIFYVIPSMTVRVIE